MWTHLQSVGEGTGHRHLNGMNLLLTLVDKSSVGLQSWTVRLWSLQKVAPITYSLSAGMLNT